MISPQTKFEHSHKRWGLALLLILMLGFVGHALYRYNQKLPQSLHTGHAMVSALAFSPNGKVLVTVAGGKVQAWNTASLTLQRTFDSRIGHDDRQTIAVSPDGKTVIHADKNSVQSWNLQTGELQHTLSIKATETLYNLSPHGDLIVTREQSNSARIRIRDARTGAVKQAIQPPGNPEIILISPDGRTLLTHCFNAARRTITQLWNAQTGALTATFPINDYRSHIFAFSPNSRTLASLAQSVELWDIRSGTLMRQIPLSVKEDEGPAALTFSADSKNLVVGFAGRAYTLLELLKEQNHTFGHAEIFDVQKGHRLYVLPGQRDEVIHMIVSPDGRYLAIPQDGVIKLWHLGRL